MTRVILNLRKKFDLPMRGKSLSLRLNGSLMLRNIFLSKTGQSDAANDYDKAPAENYKDGLAARYAATCYKFEAFTGEGIGFRSANSEISLNGLHMTEVAKNENYRLARVEKISARLDHQLQTARLAFQPSALLGRAVPDCLEKLAPDGESCITKRCRKVRCPFCRQRSKITNPPPVVSHHWPEQRNG